MNSSKIGQALVTGGAEVRFKILEFARRPGDPVTLTTDTAAIRQNLRWRPSRDNILVICESAFRWEQKLVRTRAQTGIS